MLCINFLLKLSKFSYKHVIKPGYFFGVRRAKPVVINIYRVYLFTKKRFYKNSSNIQRLTAFLHKYGTHLAALAILIFVLTNNLQATAGTDNLINNKSILYSFLGDSLNNEEIIEESPIGTDFSNFSRKYVSANAVGNSSAIPQMETANEQETQIETTGTMAGGNTLKKPLFAQDEPVLARQKLLDDIVIYTVKEGDSIGSIAQEFGISVNTVLWENKLRSRDYIKPGQRLTILPTSGIRHTVKRGENLKRIALRYKIDQNKILQFNNLKSPSLIHPGQKIIIPEGAPVVSAVSHSRNSARKYISNKIFNKSKHTPNPKTGMIWPTPGKVITQFYNWKHHGLDIDGITGDPLRAVADGTVIISGWNNGGYGLQVVINHGNGIKTRYAHCSKLTSKAGDKVTQGDVICLMGSTGRSTGSHLHFEVIVNGVRRNPLNYIKR